MIEMTVLIEITASMIVMPIARCIPIVWIETRMKRRVRVNVRRDLSPRGIWSVRSWNWRVMMMTMPLFSTMLVLTAQKKVRDFLIYMQLSYATFI